MLSNFKETFGIWQHLYLIISVCLWIKVIPYQSVRLLEMKKIVENLHDFITATLCVRHFFHSCFRLLQKRVILIICVLVGYQEDYSCARLGRQRDTMDTNKMASSAADCLSQVGRLAI